MANPAGDVEFGITKNSVEGIATPLRRSQPSEDLGTIRTITKDKKTGETTYGDPEPLTGKQIKREEF